MIRAILSHTLQIHHEKVVRKNEQETVITSWKIEFLLVQNKEVPLEITFVKSGTIWSHSFNFYDSVFFFFFQNMLRI